MKINILSFILSASFLGLVSCSDFLQEEMETSISTDYIYSTPEGLESGVTALKSMMRMYDGVKDGGASSGDYMRSNCIYYTLTDLVVIRTYNEAVSYGPDYKPTTIVSKKWTSGYEIIDRANALISALPAVQMEEQSRNLLMAHAKYYRAKVYFDLIRTWDNIVLDTIPTNSANVFDKKYEVADPTDVFNLLCSDLDYSIKYLSYGVEFGEIGQGAARHLRAQVALWQKDWATAAEQCDEIINSGYNSKGKYDLVPIDEVFGQNVDHVETIFAYNFDKALSGGSSADEIAKSPGGEGHSLAGYFTARNYELMGGEIIKTPEQGGNCLGWAFPNNYLKSLYDKEHDKRFETYYFTEKLTVNNPSSPNYGQPLAEDKYEDNYRRCHWSLRKYLDLDKPLNSDVSFKPIIVYRLAETYLMGAEAHWRLSGNSQDPIALEYINKVRNRAGLEDYPIENIDLQVILDENARELAFEKGRWFLLKRLGVLVEQVNKYHMVGSTSENERVQPMEEHFVRFPIPQSQIEAMKTFPQNPGYPQ